MHHDEKSDQPPTPEAEPASTSPAPEQAAKDRRRSRRRRAPRRVVGRYSYATAIAAAKLDLDEAALRQRARRCSRLENGRIVARLGMGVVARKFGSTWRFFFEDEDKADAT